MAVYAWAGLVSLLGVTVTSQHSQLFCVDGVCGGGEGFKCFVVVVDYGFVELDVVPQVLQSRLNFDRLRNRN